MFIKTQQECFNTDHIARIRRVYERDPLASPCRYEIDLVNTAQRVVVVGEDLPAFEAWLKKECPRMFAEPKTEEAKKVA